MTANNGALQEFRRVISILKKVLASHARVEEDLLFPALDPHLGQMRPFTVMRSEHQRIDDLMEAMNREDDADALNSLTAYLLASSTLGDRCAARRKVVVDGQGCMAAT